MRSWGRVFVRAKGWNALIWLAFCLVVASLGINGDRLAARFARDGVMVPVTVADLRTYPDQRHRRVAGRVTIRDVPWVYFGTFDYIVAGRHFRVEQQIKVAEYWRFSRGRIELMRVLPDAPTRIETTLGETQDAARVAKVTAAVLGFVTLAVAWWYALDLIREVAARRGQHLHDAVVTNIRPSMMKGRPTGHGQMFWQGADGQTGQSYSRRMADFAGLVVGSPIKVVMQGGKSYWVDQSGSGAG